MVRRWIDTRWRSRNQVAVWSALGDRDALRVRLGDQRQNHGV